MLQNNEARLNIWLTLKNRLDVVEMSQTCELAGVPKLPVFEFAKKVGLMQCAQVSFPDLPLKDAYLKFVQEYANVPETEVKRAVQAGTATTIPGSCCGGGRVL